MNLSEERLSDWETVVEEAMIVDEMNSLPNHLFLSGVVEGFYGVPWTGQQRERLFKMLHQLSLNTYIYAPKDDIKHRKNWRLEYNEVECSSLRYLIKCANDFNVNFIYTISPGNDITFSDDQERTNLKNKLQQVIKLGAHGIGILFDDIDPQLNKRDKKVFESSAAAQVDLTNHLYEALDEPKIFLFCPTEYCTAQAKPTLVESEYLKTVGNDLRQGIDIFWTGPRVVSLSIPVDHIQCINAVLKRKPIIWDNLHANDYDQHQIFLGPYDGRPVMLYPNLRGVVINPNCQFDLNFMPLYSFSLWLTSASSKYSPRSDDSGQSESTHIEYHPHKVFQECCKKWREEFYVITHQKKMAVEENGSVVGEGVDLKDDEDSADSSSSELTRVLAAPIFNDISSGDIYLVANFLYLPFQFGRLCYDFIANFKRIKHFSSEVWQQKFSQNFAISKDILDERAKFKNNCDRILSAIKKILHADNRDIVQQLAPFVKEIREALLSMKAFIHYLEIKDEDSVEDFVTNPDCMLLRSRFSREIEKILPSFSHSDMKVEDPEIINPHFYVIRMGTNSDKERLEAIVFTSLVCKFGLWDDMRPVKRLSTLRYLETFFRANHELFVIEDAENLCGYLLLKTHSNPDLETQIKDELVAPSTVPEFRLYPTIVPEIIKKYPMRVFFCFQVGFHKHLVFNKLAVIVMEKLSTMNIAGCHVVLDKYKIIESSLLKSIGFVKHPDSPPGSTKYYVLDNNIV